MNGYFWLLAVIVSVLLLIQIEFQISVFSANLSYIRIEILRNDGAEREHWIREKKRLWLSLIPFYNPHRKRHH